MLADEVLGDRICVIGCSSSGKSSLAKVLAKKSQMQAYHLDFIAHRANSNWIRTSDKYLLSQHRRVILNNRWVIEGNYSVCMNDRFTHATSVIWLDFNVIFCVMRYIKRSIRNDPDRAGKLQGAKKEFSFWLVKHILFVYPRRRKQYQALINQHPHLTVIHITSINELKSYYAFWGLGPNCKN